MESFVAGDESSARVGVKSSEEVRDEDMKTDESSSPLLIVSVISWIPKQKEDARTYSSRRRFAIPSLILKNVAILFTESLRA